MIKFLLIYGYIDSLFQYKTKYEIQILRNKGPSYQQLCMVAWFF